MNKSAKLKMIVSVAVLMINVICTAFVYIFSIESTALKIMGSYVAIVIVSAVVWFFPMRFYVVSHIFVVFACSLGSCINLYRHLDFYDIFVHFLSGILLFEGGRIIIEKVNKKRGLSNNRTVIGLFSFFFSSSCAAFWEIYEYLCDVIIDADMQGSKANTMGDIIAGILGAMVSIVVLRLFLLRRDNEKKFK